MSGEGFIYRLLSVAAWRAAQRDGAIAPAELRDEGFIHCSTAAQVPATVASLFADTTDLLVAEIALADLDVDVRWEVAPDRPADGRFPHALGSIPTAAVRRTVPWRRWTG